MGYAEEAKVHLARAKAKDSQDPSVLLQVAAVEAALAIVDAVDAANSYLASMADGMDELVDRVRLMQTGTR